MIFGRCGTSSEGLGSRVLDGSPDSPFWEMNDWEMNDREKRERSGDGL